MSDLDDVFASDTDYISAHERKLYETFVKEFTFDYNITLAAVRMGYGDEEATEIGRTFYMKPYVQKLIAARVVAQKEPDEKADRDDINRERVLAALLREAHYTGAGSSHAARVNALSRLCSIYGMDAPKTVNTNTNYTGNILVVPSATSCEDWEAQAVKVQEETLKNARH